MKITLTQTAGLADSVATKPYFLVDTAWKISLLSLVFSSCLTVGVLWLLDIMYALPVGLTISTFCSVTASYVVGRVLLNYHDRIIAQQGILAEQAAELRELNRLLSRSNEDLRAFSHMVAHDLKTPAGHIAGFAETLKEMCRRQDGINPTMGELAARIERSGYRMTEIIDALLLLGQLNHVAVTRHQVDMGRVLERVCALLEKEIAAAEATVSMPETWPAVSGYAPWLEIVWTNLISNSLKYGGKRPRLVLAAEPAGGLVRFWVRDDGPGISAEDQERLFAEFSRLGHGEIAGHGLGLSITRRIIEKLDGRVGVESAPGEGSTFFFCLPGAPQAVPTG